LDRSSCYYINRQLGKFNSTCNLINLNFTAAFISGTQIGVQM
jgi:hypothetical protein